MKNIITPILAQWDVTAGCNFSCPFCLSSSGKRSKNELDFKQACTIIDKLHSSGVLFLRFLGGEPFYRKDMLEVMKYVAKKGMLMVFSTNGSLITKKTAKTLKEIHENISYFQISLYGTNRQYYHEFTTNSKSFSLVEKGINILKEYNLKPYLFWVLTDKNINQLEAAYELTRKWELPALRISLKLNLGRGKINHDDNSKRNPNLWSQAIEKLLTLKSLVDKYKQPRVELHARPLLGEYLYKQVGLPFFYIPCKAATTMLYLDSEGRCSPCPFGYFMPESYCSYLNLKGANMNLLEHEVSEIWQSELFESYRRLYDPELHPKEINKNCRHFKSGNCSPCIYTPCICNSTIKMINETRMENSVMMSL
ncbi:MAG: radical SAM protein [Bacteroidetes bacterium]|nr:radical SAM protein [Bacteroidota bacterium]